MKCEEEINGSWESEYYMLKQLEPKTKCMPISKGAKFKANAKITMKFLDNGEAKTLYEFDKVKPI